MKKSDTDDTFERRLEAIVRELRGVSIFTTELPEGVGFGASIDVPAAGDYAVGYGMTIDDAVSKAADAARRGDVSK